MDTARVLGPIHWLRSSGSSAADAAVASAGRVTEKPSAKYLRVNREHRVNLWLVIGAGQQGEGMALG